MSPFSSNDLEEILPLTTNFKTSYQVFSLISIISHAVNMYKMCGSIVISTVEQ